MKRRLTHVKKKIYTEEPNRIEWGLAVIIFLFIFCTMFYRDNLEIFSIHFYENEKLFAGQSFDSLGSRSLPYGIMHQWFCELWVLPINLLHHVVGIEINSPWAILWCKLCIPLAMILCIKETVNIARMLNIEEIQIKWLCFLLVTSILVTLPVFHVAQTDALYLIFVLKGFRALLNGDKKHFLLWFTISVSFKIFTLFFFIPLILLKEKKILYLFRDLIVGCIIIPIQTIWYRIVAVLNGVLIPDDNRIASADVSIVEVESTADSVTSAVETMEAQAEVVGGFLNKIFNDVLFFRFPAVRKEYTASLLVFLFTLLCIWCYMQKNKNDEEWKKKCLYGIVVAQAIFFLMVSPGPYWIVIMYPFLYLLLYINEGCLRFNLLLEKAFTLTLFAVYVMSTYWVYGGSQSFNNLWLVKWGIIPSGHELMGKPNVARYLEKAGIFEFVPIITAICLASMIGIAWINHPKTKCKEELTEEYKIELQHGFALSNLAILLMWYIINIVLIGRY